MKRMPWKSERDGEGLERLVREKNTGRQLWREGRERERLKCYKGFVYVERMCVDLWGEGAGEKV